MINTYEEYKKKNHKLLTKNMYRSTEEKKFMCPDIIGSSNLGMREMEQAARKSST